jgi:hypothetical protein
MDSPREDDPLIDEPPIAFREDGLDPLELRTAELIDNHKQNETRRSLRRRCDLGGGCRPRGPLCPGVVVDWSLTSEGHQTAAKDCFGGPQVG